jgi:hypothetical protein
MSTVDYLGPDLAMEGLIRMQKMVLFWTSFCLDSNPVGCEMLL